MPTDQDVNTPPPDDDVKEDARPPSVSDAEIRRAAWERDDRESCLYRALHLTIGDDRFEADPTAIIDLAEYIRNGARGVPLPPPPIVHAEPGVDIEQGPGVIIARVAERTARHNIIGSVGR